MSPDLQPLVLLIQALSSAGCSHHVPIRDVICALPSSLGRMWSVLWELSLLLQRCHPAQERINLIAVLLQLFGSFHLKSQRLWLRMVPFIHV